MRKLFMLFLLCNFCSLSAFADTISTNNCLRNLYETESEIKSVKEDIVVTKPKRKLFCRKQKQIAQPEPEVIIPIQQGGFIVFPNNKN